MSKVVTKPDYADELTRFYSNETIDPSKPFPLYFGDRIDTLFARKGKMSFDTADKFVTASFVLGVVSGVFMLVGLAFVSLYACLGLLGVVVSVILGMVFSNYVDSEGEHIEKLRQECQKNEAYKNAYRTWLNDRYDFSVDKLTDDVLNSSVFKIDDKYFAKKMGNRTAEIAYIREASEAEITAYEEAERKAKMALKEAPLSNKVKDKLEVTYL